MMVQEAYRKFPKKGSLIKSVFLLHPARAVNLVVRHNGVEAKATFEIVDFEQENVISGDLAKQLRLIQRLSDVSAESRTTVQLPPQFSNVPDLRKVIDRHHARIIKIDSTDKDVVHAVRRQPETLKWTEIERSGHITKVIKPTEWVSSIVSRLGRTK